MQITLGPHYNVGEKPTVIPYIYITRHAGTPVWKLCMGINISVQYNGGFLPDIILLTQSYLRGTRLNTMHGLCAYNLYNSILLLHCLMVYYIVSGLFLLFFWCPCMASNVSVQYNGGFPPDIILLTQCYYHRATRLNAMKRFCISAIDPT